MPRKKQTMMRGGRARPNVSNETVNAPPNSTYRATLLVNIGQIPPTVYHTTAERWYNVPMTGAQQDPLNNNWYKRVEPVTVSIAGSLASSTTVNIETKPVSQAA
jgi:hypothetical protein